MLSAGRRGVEVSRSRGYEVSRPFVRPWDPATSRPRDSSSGVVHERNRPVVLELDDHHFAEAARPDVDAGRSELAHEEIEQLPGSLRLLGVVEARSATLRDRSGERELGDGENRAASLGDVPVHPARIVREDAQLADLPAGVEHLLRRIALLYSR